MQVEQLMTPDVVTVAPETPLKEVAMLLATYRISGVPVCDGDGRVLGVVSEGDILWKVGGADGDERTRARTAGEAMTSPAVAIAPGADVAEAARSMLAEGVNRLPVVEDGRLVGIVTRADLVRAFQRPDAEVEAEIAGDVLLNTLWVAPDTVAVAVSGGEATLAGEVENRTTAQLVEAYVRRVPGIVGVRSELTWKDDDLARRTTATARPPREP